MLALFSTTGIMGLRKSDSARGFKDLELSSQE
jgi:hypothetical protein